MEWRLLEGVPADDVRTLLSIARRRTFRKGEVVFHQHDPADSLHLSLQRAFQVRGDDTAGRARNDRHPRAWRVAIGLTERRRSRTDRAWRYHTAQESQDHT